MRLGYEILNNLDNYLPQQQGFPPPHHKILLILMGDLMQLKLLLQDGMRMEMLQKP